MFNDIISFFQELIKDIIIIKFGLTDTSDYYYFRLGLTDASDAALMLTRQNIVRKKLRKQGKRNVSRYRY